MVVEFVGKNGNIKCNRIKKPNYSKRLKQKTSMAIKSVTDNQNTWNPLITYVVHTQQFYSERHLISEQGYFSRNNLQYIYTVITLNSIKISHFYLWAPIAPIVLLTLSHGCCSASLAVTLTFWSCSSIFLTKSLASSDILSHILGLIWKIHLLTRCS